jgi:5-methyltetrahydrofolate--homocysteine methyltransferase
MIELKEISRCVQSGNIKLTAALVTRALEENYPPDEILRKGLAAGIMETERRFRRNEILNAEVFIADQAMKAGLDILMPVFEKEQTKPIGTVIIGTMEGDIRETEKRVTSCLMRSLALRVIDLGTSVSCMRFIEAAIDEKAQIIACNANLTTFLPQMKALVQAANQANIRNRTKILLSGGSVTEWFCKSIDADMYAPDLIQAADMAADYCSRYANSKEMRNGGHAFRVNLL